MGEQVYTVVSIDGEEHYLQFSEDDDSYRCLCSFPTNDEAMGMDAERVRSLALLGAAVCLAHQDMLDHGILPLAVPEWIRKGIDRAVGVGIGDNMKVEEAGNAAPIGGTFRLREPARSDQPYGNATQFPPQGGSGVPGVPMHPARSVELAIILDMIAVDLALEIDNFQQANEGLDCTELWAIEEQIEGYSKWARGIT